MFPQEPSSVDGDDDSENTFQFDEDTLPELSSVDSVAIKAKSKRRRRKPFVDCQSQQKFCDNYFLTEDSFLGGGSYGVVYQCVHRKRPDEDLAVKVIDKKGHSRTRLLGEIEILHQCKGHSNIIQLLDFIEEEERYFLVFEKINGGPLLDHIAEHRFFSEREACAVIRDISSSLNFLHSKGIAHRDLKPANILCVNTDTASPVKICDFDLASAPWTREKNNNVSSDLISPVGSAEYMAPEVVNLFIGQAAVYDKRCDMWSLGVIMYILLCGYPPFVGNCDGIDCGWNEGDNCTDCQSLLMESIQRGNVTFPDESWGHISIEAKNLLRSLLERDADKRPSPQNVLDHLWMSRGPELSSLTLDTPCVLQRTNSTTYMSDFADHLIATNRVLSQAQVFHGHERPRLDTVDSGFDGDHVDYLSSLDVSTVSFSFGDFDVSDDDGLDKMGPERGRFPPLVVTSRLDAGDMSE